MLKTPTELAKLTEAEHTYLQGYVRLAQLIGGLLKTRSYHQLLSALIQRSVLDSLPESLQHVDRAGMCAPLSRCFGSVRPLNVRTDAEPDLNKAVHFLVRRDCGPVRLPGCVPSLSLSNECHADIARTAVDTSSSKSGLSTFRGIGQFAISCLLVTFSCCSTMSMHSHKPSRVTLRDDAC